MPLIFRGNQTLRTLAAPALASLYGATEGWISLRMRIEEEAVADAGEPSLFAQKGHEIFNLSLYPDSRDVTVAYAFGRTAGSQVGSLDVPKTPVGTAVHIMLVYSAGRVRTWVDGVMIGEPGNIMDVLGRATSYQGGPYCLGHDHHLATAIQPRGSHSGRVTTLGEMCVCKGSPPSLSQILAIRDGDVLPWAVAPSDVLWAMSLDGPPGQAAQVGDPGLADLGPHGVDIATIANGAPVYAAQPLAFKPPSVIRPPRLGPSRKTVVLLFEDNQGALVKLTSLASPGTIRVGGVAVPYEGPIWSNTPEYGYYAAYSLEEAVPEGAVVTFSAPPLWARTSAGEVAAVAERAVEEVGSFLRPFVDEPKTMTLGYNNTIGYPYAETLVYANICRQATEWHGRGGAIVLDPRGYVASMGTASYAVSVLLVTFGNGWDEKGYRNGPTDGIWTVKWKGKSPGAVPPTATLSLRPAAESENYLVFELLDDLPPDAQGYRKRTYRITVDMTRRHAPQLELRADGADFDQAQVYPPHPGIDPDNPPLFHPEYIKLYGPSCRSIRYMQWQNTNTTSVADVEELLDDPTRYNFFGALEQPFVAVVGFGPDPSPDAVAYARAQNPFLMPIQIRTAAPHGFKDGQIGELILDGTGGPNGDGRFPLAGGGWTTRWEYRVGTISVTGPDTFRMITNREPGSVGFQVDREYTGAELGGPAKFKMYREIPGQIDHMIALCEEVGAEPHIHWPHGATNELVAYMADRIAARMPPGMNCRFEYTNEPWNFGFLPCHWITSEWAIRPLCGDPEFNAPGSTAGSGYQSPPAVVFSSPTGSGASAEATLGPGGQIIGIKMLSRGHYPNDDITVSFVGGNPAIPAVATVKRGVGRAQGYIRRAAQCLAITRERFAQAGRAQVPELVVNAQGAWPGGFTIPAAAEARIVGLQGWVLGISTYLGNGPNFAAMTGDAIRQAWDRMTDRQLSEMLDLTVEHGSYGRFVSDHRPWLDLNGFEDVPIIAYEAGPEYGLMVLGYTEAKVVGGGGAGAVLGDPVVTDGAVVSFPVLAGGSGYDPGTTTISIYHSFGRGATATATVVGGAGHRRQRHRRRVGVHGPSRRQAGARPAGPMGLPIARVLALDAGLLAAQPGRRLLPPQRLHAEPPALLHRRGPACPVGHLPRVRPVGGPGGRLRRPLRQPDRPPGLLPGRLDGRRGGQ
jgi:hypothetical protein